jgi:hypothetical protein
LSCRAFKAAQAKDPNFRRRPATLGAGDASERDLAVAASPPSAKLEKDFSKVFK